MCKGRIEIIIGCMFSGKSSELIKIMKRYKILKKNILAISHSIDNRYNDSKPKIVTHDKVSYDCLQLNELNIVKDNDNYTNADLIIIEEAQFFSDLFEFVINAADNDNKTVIVAGLDGDYKKEPFGDILRLIPHSEKVTKLEALCLMCGDGTPAHFTKRIIDNDNQTLVGSTESYIAVCRKHFKNN